MFVTCHNPNNFSSISALLSLFSLDFPKDMGQDDSCSLWNHREIVLGFVPSSTLTHWGAERKHPATAISTLGFVSWRAGDLSYFFLLIWISLYTAYMETDYNRRLLQLTKLHWILKYLSVMARFQDNILLFKEPQDLLYELWLIL